MELNVKLHDLVNGPVSGSSTEEKSSIGKQIGLFLYQQGQENGVTNEKEKEAYEAKLTKKIKNGEKLTPKEMSYIQKNMPDLYPVVMRQQQLRETVVKACESCESKQEVQEVYNNYMSSISEKDPYKEMMQSAIENAVKEFKESGKYKSLPEKTKQQMELEEKRQKNVKAPVSTSAQSKHITYEVKLGDYQETYQESQSDTENENESVNITGFEAKG